MLVEESANYPQLEMQSRHINEWASFFFLFLPRFLQQQQVYGEGKENIHFDEIDDLGGGEGRKRDTARKEGVCGMPPRADAVHPTHRAGLRSSLASRTPQKKAERRKEKITEDLPARKRW